MHKGATIIQKRILEDNMNLKGKVNMSKIRIKYTLL